MEELAIVLLAVMIALGCAAFIILLQFLALSRENQKLFKRIMEEISALGRQVDGLTRAAGPGSSSDQVD